MPSKRQVSKSASRCRLVCCSLGAHLATAWSCLHNLEIESAVIAGFDCVSVLANHPRLGPLRSGVCWDAEAGAYVADPLLRAVEPPVAGAETGPIVRVALLVIC